MRPRAETPNLLYQLPDKEDPMAIPTTVSIKYTCGHTQSTDLSGIPAGQRKAHAYGLGKNRVCARCFAKNNTAERDEFLRKRNAEELAEAEVFEETHELEPIQGSDKQLSWATRARYKLLSTGMEAPSTTGEAFAGSILPAARGILQAGWWINNADTDPEDVEELVTTAEPGQSAQYATENPF